MDNLIIFCAKYLIFIIGLIVLVVWLRQGGKQRYELALAVVVAAITALVLAKLAGMLYYHPRPFIAQNIQPLIAHGNDNGFPSEHEAAGVALATIIYFYHRRVGAIAFVLAAIVGIGRVAAHVHSPIDILGGAVLGVLAGISGYWLARKFLSKWTKPAVK